MHPQTLRKYDREGLVSPSRTQGSRRLYSEEDLERLQIVRRLSEDLGLNLSGVGLVLELVQHMRGMLEVLENSEDLTNSASAKAVTDENQSNSSLLGGRIMGADGPNLDGRWIRRARRPARALMGGGTFPKGNPTTRHRM